MFLPAEESQRPHWQLHVRLAVNPMDEDLQVEFINYPKRELENLGGKNG